MASFKVPCPSCENEVLITNPSVIGTKTECPKCKYRFKVEEPAGGLPKDEAKGDKADKGKGKDKDKNKKDKGKDKKTAPATAEGKKKSKKLVAFVVGGLAVVVLAVVGFAMMGGGEKKSTAGKGGPIPKGPPPVVPNTTGTQGTNDGSDPKEKVDPKDNKKDPEVKVEPIDPRRKQYKPSDKDERATTNLLPPETAALFRFDYPRIRQTPFGLIFDPVMAEMFQNSFGFQLSDIATYYHAFVGKAREPFGLIHLRAPLATSEDLPKPVLDGAPQEIKKRKLFTIKSSPFVTGAANALSFRALFGDYFVSIPTAASSQTERTMGVCVYDSQHVLVGDHKLLSAFLSGLDAKGLPPFSQTAAENPMYLSLDPKLKRALQDIGSESGYPAAILYAEQLTSGQYDLRNLKSDYHQFGVFVEPVISRTRYVSASLNAFNPKQLAATIRLVMDSESSAADAIKEHLTPGLTAASLALTAFLNSPVEFGDQAASGSSPPGPGGEMGTSGAAGFPPGGGLRPPKFGQRPPGGLGGSSSGPPPGFGGGMRPPGPGGGEGIPGGGEGIPGGGSQPPTPDSSQPTPSHLGLGQTDQTVTITVELNFTEDTYRRIIAPRLIGIASTIKGQMAIYASEQSYYALSRAVPRMLAATKAFPRGTSERRQTDAARMGIRFKPETHVSFFAELLPYINPARAALAVGLNRDLAWTDEKNLHVAEGWVPELLVPLYPQSAWRARWPELPGRVFGGTNYVAIAGKGLDAARYDPKTDAAKVGITGYEWGSKVEEVTDGLENTIYLMQTPPGLPQPWLAGGGATIRGLDETDPMKGFRHTHGTPDGKPGTFALMGDGSVRFIPGDIDPKLLLAMATRAGGEKIADRLDKEAPLVYSPHKKEAELKSDPKRGSDSKVTDPRKKDPKGKEPLSGAPGPREKKGD